MKLPMPASNVVVSIVCLCFTSSPLAIVRGIIPIVVYTIYSKKRRLNPHILQEVFKLCPTFAYRNATPTISVVVRMSLVIAALKHRFPHMIRRLLTHPVGYAQTPAGLCETSSKLVSTREANFSAVALTFPQCMALLISPFKAENFETFKAKAD